MKNVAALIIVCIVSFSEFSCRKDKTTQTTADVAGYRYFPIDTGYWVIYQVDSITISSSHPPDTFHYRLKEYIPSTFIDNSGKLTERIERYVWNDAAFVWNIVNVWTSNVHPNDAEKVEDNIRFVKLSFPVILNATWNGNSLNSFYPEWDYVYTAVDQPLSIGRLSFDSTITVLQVDQSNLVYKQYGLEKYAKGVGMIYKEFKIDSTNSSNGTYHGFELKMTIESYKK